MTEAVAADRPAVLWGLDLDRVEYMTREAALQRSRQRIEIEGSHGHGNLIGDEIGDAFGFGGLGVSGTGWGGGGTGEGTIGLGRIGTMGHGAGTGSGLGYGRGPSSRMFVPPTVRARPPTVTGGISADAVRRVTLRNLGQIGFCYERSLRLPGAMATPVSVSVRYVINPIGVVASSTAADTPGAASEVATCISSAVRRWAFPTSEDNMPVTVMSTFDLTPPPDGVPTEPLPPSNLLTGAAVPDNDRREAHLQYLSRHDDQRAQWAVDLSRRVRIRVVDPARHPIAWAHVTVTGPGWSWEARTHADGECDFFPSFESSTQFGTAMITARAPDGTVGHASVRIPSSGDLASVAEVQVQGMARPVGVLDLAFLIDVTGSMEDELRYINAEVVGLVRRVEESAAGVRVRVSATFYRDRLDDEFLLQIPFGNDVAAFARAMQDVHASGGGDEPEDLDAGLHAALRALNWSRGPAARVIVLIADAPPQRYTDTVFHWQDAARLAIRHGIRILPVGASGTHGSAEYVFRALGALTATPYVFLTDDSGIGNTHTPADTDQIVVERLNDLLTRMITSDAQGHGMHGPPPGTRPYEPARTQGR